MRIRLPRFLSRIGSVLLLSTGLAGPAFAQTLTDQLTRGSNPDARLFVELGPGSSTTYDRNRDIITLKGDVKLYYDGRTLEADRIVYDRSIKRVRATGNIRVTEVDGTIYFSNEFDLTSDFKDGFVEHFRAVTKDNQRVSASRVERTDGEQTIFEHGIYTPCLPCAENPEKAPLWQIKANRMIAKNSEQMLYFEDARLEFWGVPVIYTPYFSMPDPSVRRKSGFLTPVFGNTSVMGYNVSVPYFFNLAPNYDFTITPTLSLEQGLLLRGDWRHRLENGSYSVSAAGIYQLDPGAFRDPPFGPGETEFRGSISSIGEFAINDKWKWGWSGTIATDRYFYRDYISPASTTEDASYLPDQTSTLYLTGQGERSWIDLRGYYFATTTPGASQARIPVVLPTLEYDRRFETAFGAEFGLRAGMYNLYREDADARRLSIDAIGAPDNGCLTSISGKCSIVGGFAGTSTAFDVSLSLKKTITDSIGQQWTPFAALNLNARTYAISKSASFDAQQTALFAANDDEVGLRAMPTIGLDYRYPFFAMNSLGAHVVQPIAQIIASTDELDIGAWPNEDSQLFSFDDTNLFEWNKFGGTDRQEGGIRANLGLQYNWALANGGAVEVLAGRSFHLAGKNSYATGDGTNAGLDSGLSTDASDYVGRISLQPFSGLSLTTRARFASNDFSLQRIDTQANVTLSRLTASATYSRFEPQPLLGYTDLREGLALGAKLRFTEFWSISASSTFDLDSGATQRALGRTVFTDKFNLLSAAVGLTYKDECTTFSVGWERRNSLLSTGAVTTSDRFLVRLDLINLGDFGYTVGLPQVTSP